MSLAWLATNCLAFVYRRGEIDEAAYQISQSEAVCFFAPELSPEPTLATWRLLIEKEFPVHVFALDPDVEEQNIVAAFQRQRELQMALAVGVAKRYFGMSQRLAASRRLALEQAEIELNRVAVSFSHGNDTFGWYFHPRLQAPPAESSNAAAFARTLWSTGPTENYDLKNRRLEPGTRECEALIVMPSFLEYVDFRVTTNWEQVNHPGVTKQSYEEMIDLGRQLQCARNRIPSISDQQCFRPGDFDRLIHRFDQLEKMLSLQTHSIGVPYEYGGGTEELFSRGDAQHYPRLIGYYGVSFVKAATKPEDGEKLGVEFFLEGRNFHPTLTHVIVGGRESHAADGGAEIEVISRNLLRVTVNQLDPSVSSDGKAQVFVATPAGLSNMIDISFPKPKPEPKGFVLDKSHVWGARWICGHGLAFEPARPADETIMIKHTDAETPLLPGPYHPGLQPFVAVRVTGIGEDGKPIKLVKPGDASFLQSPPIRANYDDRSGIFHVGSRAVAGAVAAALSQHRPEPEGGSFQLNLELYVKFDAWPAEKVSPTISIKVASDCCRPQAPCTTSSTAIPSTAIPSTASPSPANVGPAPPATPTVEIFQEAVSEPQDANAEPEVIPATPAPSRSAHGHHAPHADHRLPRVPRSLHRPSPAPAPLPPIVQPGGPALRIQETGEFVPSVAQ
ncbi:MAG TPA: hypothetical protein VGN57_09685 [Pirellulaceae bacterium]|jgi:hypothetical protein|nr:hypothetical protein [Pirellulaceae bacterium]